MSLRERSDPGKSLRIPEGYVRTRSPAGTWIVLPEVAAAIGRGEADRVLAGAAARDQRPGGGRGGLSMLTLAGIPVFGKRALHGGFAAPVLRDLYLGSERAVAQIDAARRLRRASIETPEVVGIGWRP